MHASESPGVRAAADAATGVRASSLWFALLLGVLPAVAFAVLGLFHPIEVPGGEGDLYVDKAEQLLRGGLPHDIWHPLYYPALMAGAAWLCGDVFTAGKLVSALAGGAAILATALLVRRLGGAGAAVAAGLLLSLHGALVVAAAQAASDVTALMFVAVALLAAARAHDGGGRRWLVAGACGGLALGTRFQMLPLVPALLVVALAAAPRWRRGLWLGGGLLLGYLPQAIASTIAFGSPLYSEHWRNLDLKVGHDYDATATFETAPAASVWELLTEHGGRVLGALARDLGAQLGGEFGAFVAGRSLGPADLLLVLALVAGGVRAWRWPAARGAVVFAALYLPMLCVALRPAERYLLPMLPAAAVLLALLPAGLAPGWRRRLAWLPLLAATALAASALAPRVRVFLGSHPHAEIAVARALRAELTSGDAILSPFSPLMRHVPGRVVWLDAAPLTATGAELLDQLAQRTQRLGAEYVLVSPPTDARLHAALRDCRAIGGHACRVLRWDQDVAVVHCRPAPGPVRSTAIEVAADGGSSRIVVDLDAAAPASAQVLTVAVRVVDPAGARLSLLLQRDAATRFAYPLPRRLAAGAWQLEPVLLLTDRSLRSGPPLAFAIGADGQRLR